MPPKKRVDLPDHVRRAALDEIAMFHRISIDADENFKILAYLKTEQGLTTSEIAEELGVAQQSVSRYSREGKEAFLRREQARGRSTEPDPDRPGEREPIG